ncbi:hemerythrin domain-containing protein [Sinomonas sp. G460-2]|uniref:hemerythrin domain-containing protein n=1 Tax=Sinomonas sp. G460-2 TaxID=3393464 RepID=UPI0039EFBB3D
MAARLPREGTPPTGEDRGCDTSGMLVVHRMLRRWFADAPQLVRAVPPGDTKRSAVIGSHVSEFAQALHNHHATEDDLLWDTLESRSPACALHVAQMKARHQAVAVVLRELEAVLLAWQNTADPATRDRVAEILDRVRVALATHLGQEEDQILPVAGPTMSQREWDDFGKHGLTSLPKNRPMIQLGYVLDPFTPEERLTWMKKSVPALARMLYWLVGRRQYDSDYRRVYGKAPSYTERRLHRRPRPGQIQARLGCPVR